MVSVCSQALQSFFSTSARRPAARLAVLAPFLVLGGCGIAANHKPLPAGPTAHVHVGPVTGGFRWQNVHVHDGTQCHPGEFQNFHTIGSYLGSDLDMVVPASRKLYFSLGDGENQGMRQVRCGTMVVLTPEPGVRYTMNLLYEGNRCGIAVTRTDTGERVKTDPPAPACPN